MSVMHVYGSDSGAVMLIGEHKLRVFGETVLRNIFGTESSRVKGDCRRLESGEAALAVFVTKC